MKTKGWRKKHYECLTNFFEKSFLLLNKKLFGFCFNVKHGGLTCKLVKHLSDKQMIKMIEDLVRNSSFTPAF